MERRAFISILLAGILISVSILAYPYESEEENVPELGFEINSWWGTVDGSPLNSEPGSLKEKDLSSSEFSDIMFMDNDSFRTIGHAGEVPYQMYKFRLGSSVGGIRVLWVGDSSDWDPGQSIQMYLWNWVGKDWSEFQTYDINYINESRVVHHDWPNSTHEEVRETEIIGGIGSPSSHYDNYRWMYVLVTTYKDGVSEQERPGYLDTDCIGIISPVSHVEAIARTEIHWDIGLAAIEIDATGSNSSGSRIIGYSWEFREDDEYRNQSWVTYVRGPRDLVMQHSFLDLNVTLTVRDEFGSLAYAMKSVDLSIID